MNSSAVRKEKFISDLVNSEDAKLSKYFVMNREVYAELLREIKEAKLASKKTSLQYRRVNRFDIIKMDGIERIIAKSKNDKILHYLPVEEIFDVIEKAHIVIGHGGRDRLRMETGRKYANVTTKMINLYLSMCEVCNSKKSKRKKGQHSELNSKCQVYLVDMQSQPDREYKFIMVYQDNLTKFILLRALTSKRAKEIAYKLRDIFSTLGAPCILHCDDGREFTNCVINELKSLWPEPKILQGKPSRDSVEDNQVVENAIATWMSDNENLKWSEGLPFVQFKMNCTVHSGTKQIPYKAMFGIEPRVGLASLSLPLDVISSIEREEDLEKAVGSFETNTADTEGDLIIECDSLEVKPRLCFKCGAILDADFDRDCCLNCTSEDNRAGSVIQPGDGSIPDLDKDIDVKKEEQMFVSGSDPRFSMHDSNENSSASQDQNASLEPKTELEIQQTITSLKTNDQDDGENPDGTGFHFLTHEYLSEKVTQDSINEIIDSLPKARSDLLEYLVKGDGTVVCKWCGEVLPSRTHWYRHKYKLHVPPTGLPAGLIKCIKCNTFFKSRKGYVGHCVARHGSVEEAEKEEDEEHVIIKEEKMEVFEETNVEEVLENIEKEEKNRRNNKLVDSFGRGRKRNQIKDERKEDYLKQREKEEKLVAEIIAKVKKECEDQSITMCRRGYSRRSTVMTSFKEYDKRK